MTYRHIATAAITMAALMATPTLAQDATGGPNTLPKICTDDAMDMGAPMKMDISAMDKEHQDLMQGMDQMNADMTKGMMAKDIDVAFVCGMIAHHQGAIDMAKAEIAHGDDSWAKQTAQTIIDAQTKEKAEMLDWLQKQSK